MNTAKEQIRSDMEKSPDELQREADEVRRDMEQTVDQLANQFSPGELINQTFKKLQNGSGTAFAHNLSTQIQNNPIPALLAGVSLAWLMTASKRAPTQSPSTTTHSAMGTGKGKLSSATAHTRDSGRNMVDGVKEKQQQLSRSASDMKHRVSESSHHLMDSARSGAHTARSQYEHMLQEQPLVLGMLAIAAGAALGALLPRTEQEDRAIGETSDEQKDAIKRRAEGLKEQAEARVNEKVQDEQKQHPPQSSSPPSTDANRAGHSGHTTSPTSSNTSTSSTGATHEKAQQHERGTPAASPTAAPNHPATNPPVVNPGDSREH